MNRISPPDVNMVADNPGSCELAYTRPRQEQVALANLLQQGFDAYLPFYKTLSCGRAHVGGEAIAFEPMFARYVFFRPASARQSIATVRSTRGVSTLVSFGYEPAVVRPEVMRAIRACEQARNEADLAALSPFQVGSHARLRSGPLQGLVGVVQMVSAKRVALLLELLGQPQRIEVGHHALAVA